MQQLKFKVQRLFIQYPGGRVYRPRDVFSITTYENNPYIRAMVNHGFLVKATKEDIEKTNIRGKLKDKWVKNGK